MLRRLFQSTPQPRSSASPAASVPAGTRVYAIGDIHGRGDLLSKLHDLIIRDTADYAGRRVLIYIGDYIDRGDQSRETLDHVIDLPLPGFEIVPLMGNHERTLLDFLEDITVGPMWLANGGLATLLSYGVRLDRTLPDERACLLDAQERFRERFPVRHRAFLTALKPFHVEGDYLFVHAGIRPSVPLEHQSEEDLLWIRDEFLQSAENHGKVVVHGHSISTLPENRPNRIGIDTGAYATNRLTCVRLEGSERSFLSTQSRL